MSMQAAKILMAESEARNILLGDSDPLKLERKILDVLSHGSCNLRSAIWIAARSNREDLVAKMVMAAATETSHKCRLTMEVAASNVFETSWAFLMQFADMHNAEIPRRFFGGLVWGIVAMSDKVDIVPYMSRIILAPKLPPFLYVTGGQTETEIKRIVRDWALKYPELAKDVLAETKEKMRGSLAPGWHPTPLGKMVADAVLYALLSKCNFATKLDIAKVL